MKELITFLLLWITNVTYCQVVAINGPAGSGEFGKTVFTLPNGNYVICDPKYSEGALTQIGAVYLYNGTTHTIISTLKGNVSYQQVGNAYYRVLPNGNFLVASSLWGPTGASGHGAVTFINGTTGLNGVVNSSNSLIGSNSSDQVGSSFNFIRVYVLLNNDFVILSPNWDNGTAADAGACTWGSGVTGVSGVVSASNSIVGTNANDRIGFNTQVTSVGTNNYVLVNQFWNSQRGAATWCNGNGSTVGIINSSNSLVGANANDGIDMSYNILPINNNYLIRIPFFDNGSFTDAGAIAWGDGNVGITGTISSSNSLCGYGNNYYTGYHDRPIAILTNGNYVVPSGDRAVWCNGTTGRIGTIDAAMSFNGCTGVEALTNGNYVIKNFYYSGYKGAVTLGDGVNGTTGSATVSNSLVGVYTNDQIGNTFITKLTNGNFVVTSSGFNANKGSVTWCSGNLATPTVGEVSATNSIIGTNTNDFYTTSNYITKDLTNGNYFIVAPYWDNGVIVDAGAVRLCSGTSATTGNIDATNSLVGSQANDLVGKDYYTPIALTNGNFVVTSPNWDNGSIVNAGAATWCSGNVASPTVGAVNSSNSLVGSSTNDYVGGTNSQIINLTNGNAVVLSQLWDNGTMIDAGAATWMSGTAPTTGVISSANSYIGSTAGDSIGYQAQRLSNGNYVLNNRFFDNGSIQNTGAITWGDGTSGSFGVITAANSLVGSSKNDFIGSYTLQSQTNGSYFVSSGDWDNFGISNAGAVTLVNPNAIVTGAVNSCNSAVGNSNLGSVTNTYSHNTIFNYTIVGKPLENKTILLFGATNPTLSTHLDSITKNITVNSNVDFLTDDCKLVATVQPTGASPISGNTKGKIYIESTQPTVANSIYVKRHFEITPSFGAASATGRVTLYCTQQEFDEFNAVSPIDLPFGPTDLSGKANLLIEKRAGSSSNFSGALNTYGTAENILVNDDDIVWNPSMNRWEISFNTTGFSGFWIKTITDYLPLHFTYVHGNRTPQFDIIQWGAENIENVKHFYIEESNNGLTFYTIDSTVKNNTNNYTFKTQNNVTSKKYYRITALSNNNSKLYSKVITITATSPQNELLPNLVSNQTRLFINNKSVINTYGNIFNANGKLIQTFFIKNNIEELNFSTLTSGYYFIVLKNGETIKFYKY